MKKVLCLITAILLPGIHLLLPSNAIAATDGTYNMFQVQSAWDGADASRTASTTADYDYSYGDEGSVSFALPWTFSFYGQSYSRIIADTNGNIWFSSTGSANSFNLANTGRGPVISVWNNDLSSYFHGGVFIQHKTNPERVVVEWRTETYTDEGSNLPNSFEAILYPNGSIRLDYNSFAQSTLKDLGSGISQGNGTSYISLTSAFGSPFTLSGRSYGIGLTSVPAIAIDPVTDPSSSCATLSGAMQVGSTLAISSSSGATIGPVIYQTSTSWSVTICDLKNYDNIITVIATDAAGNTSQASATITVTASAKPGDCDASGTVTIYEVQAAINMYLGLKAVAACVDIDGSNNVTINEVQKVINGYLGL